MERLTGRNEHGGIISNIENTHRDVERVKLLHALAKYEDAEEQGRILPIGFSCVDVSGKNLLIYHPRERGVQHDIATTERRGA
jgi:hypothetical protein